MSFIVETLLGHHHVTITTVLHVLVPVATRSFVTTFVHPQPIAMPKMLAPVMIAVMAQHVHVPVGLFDHKDVHDIDGILVATQAAMDFLALARVTIGRVFGCSFLSPFLSCDDSCTTKYDNHCDHGCDSTCPSCTSSCDTSSCTSCSCNSGHHARGTSVQNDGCQSKISPDTFSNIEIILDCEVGKFQDVATTSMACKTCGGGTFQDGTQGTSCKSCGTVGAACNAGYR